MLEEELDVMPHSKWWDVLYSRIAKILIIVSMLSVGSIPAAAQTKLVLSTAENVKMGMAAGNILRQAYHSIGIEIEVIQYPALRAVIMANDGEVDGELIRFKGIEAEYTNLVIVPVPIATMEGVAFTKKFNIQIAGFESLKPHRLAFRRGVKFAEHGTRGMDRAIFDSLAHAFFLLNEERVDVVIAPRLTGLDALSRLPYKGIKALEPPLIKTNFFHFLHKKHKALVPRISASLLKMKKEGRIQTENERVANELLESITIEQGH